MDDYRVKNLTYIPITAFIILWIFAGPAARAQQVFAPGSITDSVQSVSDASQQYAVYLPPAYSDDKAWPAVFIMDPRGRALSALEKFKTAAGDLGYILVSSHNTMSDGPTEPNADALNAMINDSFRHFSMDTLRLYLAGFSGTARLSWLFGFQLKKYVAGVIGFGAGQANGMVLPAKVRLEGVAFDYFGGAGYRDFNYFEMIQLDELLDQLDFRHRMVYFDGPHAWPPDSLCAESLYWMELMAIKDGRTPGDSIFIGQLLARRTAKAGALLDKGKNYAAYRAFRGIMEDFSGLNLQGLPDSTADSLGRLHEVRETDQLLLDLAGDFRSYHRFMGNYFRKFRGAENLTGYSAENIARELDIPNLQKVAADSGRPYHARYATVLLEAVYVRTSFYEANTQLQNENPRKALALLDVADRIKPGHPRNCMQYARAYTLANRFDEAFEALYCLEGRGRLMPGFLEGDSLLRPLEKDPRYSALKARLKGM